MGSDFCSCSCLNDLTKPETEDLSRGYNSTKTGKKIDNNPKILFNNNENNTTNYKSTDSVEPSLSKREKGSKNTTIISISLQNSNNNNIQKKKNKDKIINLKSNCVNGNKKNMKNNMNINMNNNIKKNFEKKPSVKRMKKEELVSYTFKNFFNTPQGQEMTLNMNDSKNKLAM